MRTIFQNSGIAASDGDCHVDLHGVHIEQAVNLKFLKDESAASASRQQLEFHKTLLPTLNNNSSEAIKLRPAFQGAKFVKVLD